MERQSALAYALAGHGHRLFYDLRTPLSVCRRTQQSMRAMEYVCGTAFAVCRALPYPVRA